MSQLRTRMNGGTSTLAEVATDWRQSDHGFTWSEAPVDKWAVDYAKGVDHLRLKGEFPIPDPRNIHG